MEDILHHCLICYSSSSPSSPVGGGDDVLSLEVNEEINKFLVHEMLDIPRSLLERWGEEHGGYGCADPYKELRICTPCKSLVEDGRSVYIQIQNQEEEGEREDDESELKESLQMLQKQVRSIIIQNWEEEEEGTVTPTLTDKIRDTVIQSQREDGEEDGELIGMEMDEGEEGDEEGPSSSWDYDDDEMEEILVKPDVKLFNEAINEGTPEVEFEGDEDEQEQEGTHKEQFYRRTTRSRRKLQGHREVGPRVKDAESRRLQKRVSSVIQAKEEGRYTCSYCPRTFYCERDQQRHIQAAEKVLDKPTPNGLPHWSCRHCSLTFVNYACYRCHTKSIISEKVDKKKSIKEEVEEFAEDDYDTFSEYTNQSKKDLVCPYCSKTFLKQRYYDGHMTAAEREKDKPKPRGKRHWACDHCSLKFINYACYRCHTKAIVGSSSATRKQRDEDVAGTDDDETDTQSRYTCPHCSKSLSTLRYYEGHLEAAEKEKDKPKPHGQAYWTCPHCPLTFTNYACFRCHTKGPAHRSRKPKDQVEKRFKKYVATKAEGGGLIYTCIICAFVTPDLQIMQGHRKKHEHNREQQLCTQCGKSYRDMQSFKTHIRHSHQGKEMRLSCLSCGQMFSTIMERIIHERTVHKGLPTHECPHPGCGKLFAIKNLLQKHQLTHTDQKPFICDRCGKGFRTNGALKIHGGSRCNDNPEEREKIRQMLRKSNPKKWLACDQCDFKTYGYRVQLRLHTNNKHKVADTAFSS